MHIDVGDVVLRMPEPRDIAALYAFKNDGATATQLGGFSVGYSTRDLDEWLEFHRKKDDEVIWAIALKASDECIGHVGFYNIDHRVGSAEFAIVLSGEDRRNQGLGQKITRAVLEYAFEFLNLQRVELSVLSVNQRAIRVYEKVGFLVEGTKRRAQYKSGEYLDIILMAMLKDEFHK